MNSLSNLHLSVVIPVYNEAQTIPNLLHSLSTQKTNFHYQVVVVDNGSTDNSIEVVKKISSELKIPLHLLSESTPGAASARKSGIDFVAQNVKSNHHSKSHDHIIAITDADTILPNNWIQSIALEFCHQEIDGISGVYTASPEIDELVKSSLGLTNYFLQFANVADVIESSFGQFRFRGPNSAFRLSSYQAINGFSSNFDSHGNVLPRECADLVEKFIKSGFKLVHFNTSIIASQRRKLKEMLIGSDTYYLHQSDHRFIAIRDSEMSLLNLCLSTVPKNTWINYQTSIINKIILNGFILPFGKGLISQETIISKLGHDLGTLIINQIIQQQFKSATDSLRSSKLLLK